ncbi:MAG: tetratricopeptide repeat protein [Bacteroidales bacterium]|nr:tetratricopeptide repeat protein [Bacteroidales bacterium]
MKKILKILLLLLPILSFGQGIEPNEYLKTGLALFYEQKYVEAIPYLQKSLDLKQDDEDTKLLLYFCYSGIDNSNGVIKYGTPFVNLFKKHKEYTSLHDIANHNAKIGNYSEAIRLETLAMKAQKKDFGKADARHSLSLANLAKYNSQNGNYDKAIRYETMVLKYKKAVYGEEHDDYANSLYTLAYYNYQNGNITEAIRLATKPIEIQKKIYGEEHQNYAYSLSGFAKFNYDIERYTEAIRFETKAMEIYKKDFGEEHPVYATSLNTLANYNFQMDNYSEAIRLGTMAMEIRKKVWGEESSNYAESLLNLASYYSQTGNYIEAIKLGTMAMEINKKVFGEDDPNYATPLCDLSYYYKSISNYAEAIRLGTIAMEIYKKTLGEEHPHYATSLSNLSEYYSIIGNYAEAIRLGTMALEIRWKELGEKHHLYASSLNDLSRYNYSIGNFAEAIRLGTMAMQIQKKIFGEEHSSYALTLSNLALYNFYIGNYNETIRLGSRAMQIQKKILGEEHPDYAQTLSLFAPLLSSIGDNTEAINLATKTMEINKKVFGEEHPKYAISLIHLAYYNLVSGNYDVATDYYKQSYHCLNSFILKTFASMTTKERSDFWNMYSVLYNNELPLVAYLKPNETLKSLAINGQLLSKGLLLNAELEIQSIIEKQGNEEIKEKYNKLKEDRNKLDNLYKQAPEKREINADSLKKVIDNEERMLVESSKELGDFTKRLSINWTDVQNNLKDNDVAIEFANFNDTSKTNIYIALILKKGMTTPELVKLFEINDFNKIKQDDYYKTSDLYNLIWKPLENHLQGIQNVYFSPTGKFHNIGIEYLPDENGEIFAKKYNAYRLSSTRELALKHVANLNKKASVYGGIVYNYTQDDWQNVSEDAERAGITFLKGAKKESEEITQILSDSSFTVTYGTDKAATEESFKKLSGSDIKILHIATHGFYEPENKENSFADMLSIGDKNSQEDLSLSRSGLFFAGANTALDPEQRKYIPEGVDDGILTAKEISRMDFKGLDLVVLSACQTGLGEVTSEGVFGLQRGFKKAGAQTIVMSLWNVSDKPTKELMTEFYRNLVAGKSKREAFISAQDKIRVKYIDPKMWAGFIMVDGIE